MAEETAGMETPWLAIPRNALAGSLHATMRHGAVAARLIGFVHDVPEEERQWTATLVTW
jgi:hypothetical protein